MTLIRPRSLVYGFVATVLLAAIAFGSTMVSYGASDEKGILAATISRVLTTPTSSVSIGEVEGALSSNATVRDIAIADRDGVWLKLDQVHLVWRRTALLLGRIEIDSLEVGTLQILRRPVPSEDVVASDEPILPTLPVKLVVKNFNLQTLDLGEPVAGVAAKLSATGNVTLGNPSEGLAVNFDAKRIDADGTFTLRLSLVPETSKLDIALKLDEPAGGLVAHAINLPGDAPIVGTVKGAGTLDDFAARLDFDAGDGIQANGSARLLRRGDGRDLALDLAAKIAGMLPAPAAPVFAGTTRLTGNMTFADSSAVDISALSLVSSAARLDIRGQLSSDQIADLTISARAMPNDGQQTSLDRAAIKTLTFDATVKGALAGPRVDASLALEDGRIDGYRLGSLRAAFHATPSGGLTDEATSVPFQASASASGLAFADPAMTRAIGPTLSATFEGVTKGGVAEIANSEIRTETARATFVGTAGSAQLRGRLSLQAPDLARFERLLDTRLRGRLDLTADFDGTPKTGAIGAQLDGKVQRFASGIAAIDGLLGTDPTLSGYAGTIAKGGYRFRDFKLSSAHAVARIDGAADPAQAAIKASVEIDNLASADKRLSGALSSAATISGTLARPNLSALVGIDRGTALGRPLRDIKLRIEATDLLQAPSGRASLGGMIDGKPARGQVQAARGADLGWRLDGIDLRIGSATAVGQAALTADRLASGQLHLDIPSLDDLAPLLLTPMSGQLVSDLALSAADGRQDGRFTVRGTDLKFGASRVDRIDGDIAVSDLHLHPVVDGTISIGKAVVGGEVLSKLRLTAKGATDASDIAITAQGRGIALEARGRLLATQALQFDLASFSARRGAHRIGLQRPSSLRWSDGDLRISDLALSLDRGRLALDGRFGTSLDVTLRADKVPLAIADMVAPELGLVGSLDASARLTGTTARPTGPWTMRIAGVAAAQTRQFGLPPATIVARGQLADGKTTIDASVAASGAGTLKVQGVVPIDGGAMDLTVRGNGNAKIANSAIGATGLAVGGDVAVDLRVRGTPSEPDIAGTATLARGSFSDLDTGIKLTDINGRLSAKDKTITIVKLTAHTPKGGVVSGSGTVRLDADAGFPGKLQLSGKRASLTKEDLVSAVADFEMRLSGPLARDPNISGRVDVVSLDVTIPESLPMTVRPIAGTRHVNAPPAVKRRLAAKAKARRDSHKAVPFDAALDLTISAPNRIFVRGRGVDAELGGQLRVGGRLSQPTTFGAFELRRGRFSIAGNQLDFTRGRLTFEGDLTPQLDFAADTRQSDITAHILITGSAASPQFAFSSDSGLPQDEVLSRILFSKASGSLSPIQALQLAQAAAQFAGAGGPDVFDRIRRSLGVDSLNISQSQNGDPTVGVSRAINNRLSVGVKGGARPEDNGVSLDFDLTRRLRLQGEVNSKGGIGAGVGAEWEY
ncbi:MULTISPECIES: translocation/assembly module TamB domain-containing protein [Rhodopseudomonas]|uniref:translocation/assembly module TamB domain-containing protein n=1 Tax=Rhodopseudomonas TaxID=1073 RepID=UPI000698BA8C|nr:MULTISPECIES: translocation/assembly module TamB domain-containing protein [Rhodopseudomonas]WOK17010.1 translocation/assembly module TamB domain-containing protein [Rhodopseudomonas sp. BAL398]